MRRSVTALLLVALLGGIGIGVGLHDESTPRTAAQSQAALSLRVFESIDTGSGAGACAIGADANGPLLVRIKDGAAERMTALASQVVIENERHEILTVVTLDNGDVEEYEGFALCAVETTVTLPTANFYNVTVDQTRVVTLPASDLSDETLLAIPLD